MMERPNYEPLLNSWTVTDPETVLQLLRHRAVAPPSLLRLIEHAQAHHQQRFDALKRAFSILPIFLAGPDHATQRKSTATFIQARAKAAEAGLRTILRTTIAPAAQKRQIDLMQDWALPVARFVTASLVGQDIPDRFCGMHLIEIFNLSQSLAKMKKLDQQFAAVFDLLGPDEEVRDKLICLVFGFDSLMSFLGENLLMAVKRAQDTGGLLELPEDPPGTGVPVSFRIATQAITLDGFTFPEDARLKLEFTRFGEASDKATRHGMFGAGAHVCLGKMVAMTVWREFRTEVNALQIRPRLLDFKVESNLFFRYFSSIQVELAA